MASLVLPAATHNTIADGCPAIYLALMKAEIANSMGRKTIWQRARQMVHTRFWKMDIHPSAWIAADALIDRTFPQGVHIEADCIIDHDAAVLTHDMSRAIYAHTYIGKGTLIGARAIVFPGVSIGDNCIVKPGSVVTKDVAPGTTVNGNPARPCEV